MTARLVCRAPAKVNLGLSVGPLREDGYHGVLTVLQSIALADELEAEEAPDLSLDCSDEALSPGEDNLVMRAGRALQLAHGRRRGARIRLTKRVPAEAGLGGGSSDAAATLVLLARLWNLPLGPEDLHPMAASLGADVPFFLLGGTALGLSRGEDVYPLPDAPPLHLVLALPSRGMPTAEAYRRLDARLTPPGGALRMAPLVRALVEGQGFESLLFNDFGRVNEESGEESAAAARALGEAGARAVIPAGSGAAWVGFFRERCHASAAFQEIEGRGIRAIQTVGITRRNFRELTVPTWDKE